MLLSRFFLMLTGCFLALSVTKTYAEPLTSQDIQLGDWVLEYERNRYGYYVHSRDVMSGDSRCKQTRIGKVSQHGNLQPPTHIFWSDDCLLPLKAITSASQDVDRELSRYALIVRPSKEAE